MPDISNYGRHYRTVHLTECNNGLGMKISERHDKNNNFLGIFVKKILDNGVAAASGELCIGDKLLQVNEKKLGNVRQPEAILYLRRAAKSGTVKLIIDKSNKTQEAFLSSFEEGEVDKVDSITPKKKLYETVVRSGSLLSKQSSNLDGESVGFTDDLNSDALNGMSPACSFRKGSLNHGGLNGRHVTASVDSGYPHYSSFLSSRTSENFNENVKTISIPCATSLGISIKQVDKHNIVSGIIDGGDVARDNRIQVGDIILSVNDDSFVGITAEQANIYLLKLKLRAGVIEDHTISFISANPNCENHIKERNMLRGDIPLTSTVNKQSNNISSPNHLHLSLDGESNPSDPLLHEFLSVMSEIEDSERASVIANEILELSQFNDDFMATVLSTPHYNDSIKTKDAAENMMSHYLNKDVRNSKKTNQKNNALESQKNGNFSLDPFTYIKLEKLEIALKRLGLPITSKEQIEIRNNLNINENGLVLYGDFVKVTRNILNMSLEDFTNSLLNSNSQTFSPSLLKNHSKVTPSNQYTMQEQIRNLRHERDVALKEAQFLRASLQDKNLSVSKLEKELQRYAHEVEAARNQCNALRRRIQQSENFQRSVIEQDKTYEKTIQKLENEVAGMKKQQLPNKEEFQELQKRAVVLGCQLRKSEISKKTHEVAVSKLIKFAANVEDILEKEEQKNSKDANHRKNRKKLTELSMAARDVIKTVNSLLEEDSLPYGWEEVYSPDGTKYFINHVNQLTSWAHPVSGVQHTTNAAPKPSIYKNKNK